MKTKFGGKAAKEIIEVICRHDRFNAEKWVNLLKGPLGVSFEGKTIKQKYTRQEEKGLHWLLAQWIKRSGMTVDIERLKHDVCKVVYGVAVQTSFGGQETHVPLRTTTKKWDVTEGRYTASPLDVEGYAHLMERIYQLAADDGIVLPELERKKAA